MAKSGYYFTVMGFSGLILAGLSACTFVEEKQVHQGHNVQLKGASRVMLINEQTVTVRDAWVNRSGVTAREYYSGKPLEIPAAYVQRVTDVDRVSGFWKGAGIGAAAGSGFGTVLILGTGPVRDAGAGFQILYIPIFATLGALGGGALGGLYGYRQYFSFPPLSATALAGLEGRLPPISSYSFPAPRSRYTFAFNSGMGMGVYPRISETGPAELRKRLKTTFAYGYRAGYALDAHATVGLMYQIRSALPDQYRSTEIHPYTGQYETITVHHNLDSGSIYYSYQPNDQGASYQISLGLANNDVNAWGALEAPFYNEYGVELSTEFAYMFRMSQHVHLQTLASGSVFVFSEQYAAVASLGLSLRWY